MTCIFLNKTPATRARRHLQDFLQSYPTAQSLQGVQPSQIECYFATLGLQKRRAKWIIKMAGQLVNDPPQPHVEVTQHCWMYIVDLSCISVGFTPSEYWFLNLPIIRTFPRAVDIWRWHVGHGKPVLQTTRMRLSYIWTMTWWIYGTSGFLGYCRHTMNP